VTASNCDFEWTGCEVLRLFDDQSLVCEIVWDVTGPCIDTDTSRYGGEASYELDFALNAAETSCTSSNAGDEAYQIDDLEYRYLLEWGGNNSDLDISWAPGGSDDFNYWTETTYSSNPSWTQITFDYETGFSGWEY
jgi:hypothetical protein